MYVRNVCTYCLAKLPVVISVTEVIFDEMCPVSLAPLCVLLCHRVQTVEKSSVCIIVPLAILIIMVLY